MKIFKPLHILSGDLWGGAEAQAYLLCKGMRELATNQVTPSILLFNHGTPEDKLLASEIPTEVTEEQKGILRILIDTYKFAKSQKSNLIISHGYKEGYVGFIVSKFLLVPWIHVIHGTSENYTGTKKYKMAFYACIERFIMRASASRIVTVSKKIATELGIENLSKHRVIYNAAESNSTNYQEGKTNLRNNIIWLGRLSSVKRPDLAVLGFKYFLDHATTSGSPLTLDMYGTGPLEEELKELCSEDPRINMCGFTNTPYKAISESALLLLTSDSEGIPTVILEAMHAKVPIVSRLVGGIPEIVCLVPDYPLVQIKDASTSACGLAIEEAIKSLPELKSKAEKSNSRFFTVNRLVEDHLILYKELI